MSCLDCRWLVVAWVAGAIAWLYVMLVVGHVMKERKLKTSKLRMLAWAAPAWPLLLLVYTAGYLHSCVVTLVECEVPSAAMPPEYGSEGWVVPQDITLRCTGPGCSRRGVVSYDTRTGSALCDDCIKKRPDVVEAIERWKKTSTFYGKRRREGRNRS